MTQKYAALTAHHTDIDRARWDWGRHFPMYGWLFERSRSEICDRGIAF